jgi:hypothetical protein
MASVTETPATLDDLYLVEGKAELVNGRIERTSPAGDLPTDVAAEIYVCLRACAKEHGKGLAKSDGEAEVGTGRGRGNEEEADSESGGLNPPRQGFHRAA